MTVGRGRLGCLLPILSGIGLAAAAPAPSSTPDAPASNAPAPDIVVEGQGEKQLHERVKALTPVSHSHQLGRWHQRICLQITGLDPLHDGIIRHIFADEVHRLKMWFDPNPKCIANVSVMIASNADEIATHISKWDTWLLVDPKEGDPPDYWKRALLQPQPVRWFVANRTVPSPESTGILSRIRLNTREETIYAYVLIDANKLNGITWRQLANYISFVALSGPMPGAPAPADSILSIFEDRDAGRPAPLSLTVADQDFLEALYATDPNLGPDMARRAIERQMTKAGKATAP
jgi:hypothetical protein